MEREKYKQCVSLLGVYYVVNFCNARGKILSFHLEVEQSHFLEKHTQPFSKQTSQQ